jgi:hypothetical protein
MLSTVSSLLISLLIQREKRRKDLLQKELEKKEKEQKDADELVKKLLDEKKAEQSTLLADIADSTVVIPVSVIPQISSDGDDGSEKADDDNDENVPPAGGNIWVEVPQDDETRSH